MQTYILKEKPESASNDMVWAFDLGKGSIGEAVRRGTEFPHKASLPCRAVAQRRRLIPAEFAETKTAAGRRRMWRTRQAHKARALTGEVMRAAGIQRCCENQKTTNWPVNTKFDVARLWSLK